MDGSLLTVKPLILKLASQSLVCLASVAVRRVWVVCVAGPHLLSTGLLQQHPQAAVVPLVVGDELAQRGEGDLLRHKVGPDGRALDPEVEHLPLAAG